MGLSDRDKAVLEFERLEWRYLGAKVAEVRDRFGLSEPRYFQLVNHLIDQPEAMAYDAPTVRRLQRLREQRARVRSSTRER
ncbi:DUF3263 domain-containing protein [Nocardioides jensenii]|uniref:DUF3263 domain-containing protein n=1 Tax=Nocardioides jensenii TaxID=1843 RepID=UPI0008342002|nr:DUF3263 domain-containing protein [Nocardioides jensenii]